MSSALVSPKFQIVIPEDARNAAEIHVGQRMQVIVHDHVVTLVPGRHPKESRGDLRGMKIGRMR